MDSVPPSVSHWKPCLNRRQVGFPDGVARSVTATQQILNVDLYFCELLSLTFAQAAKRIINPTGDDIAVHRGLIKFRFDTQSGGKFDDSVRAARRTKPPLAIHDKDDLGFTGRVVCRSTRLAEILF